MIWVWKMKTSCWMISEDKVKGFRILAQALLLSAMALFLCLRSASAAEVAKLSGETMGTY